MGIVGKPPLDVCAFEYTCPILPRMQQEYDDNVWIVIIAVGKCSFDERQGKSRLGDAGPLQVPPFSQAVYNLRFMRLGNGCPKCQTPPLSLVRYAVLLLESRTIRLHGRRTIPERISPESSAKRLSPA